MHGLWEALQILGIYRPIFFLDGEEQINYNKQFIQHDVVCSFPECENNQKFMNKSINYFNKSNYTHSTVHCSKCSALQRDKTYINGTLAFFHHKQSVLTQLSSKFTFCFNGTTPKS